MKPPQAHSTLHLYAGQEAAECPHCKGALTKETPILRGDEPEEIRGPHGSTVGLRLAEDPRPKCPHCFGRFELVLHGKTKPDTTTSRPTLIVAAVKLFHREEQKWTEPNEPPRKRGNPCHRVWQWASKRWGAKWYWTELAMRGPESAAGNTETTADHV